MNNGIDDILVADRRIEVTRKGTTWNTIKKLGTTDVGKKWDWYSKDGILPEDEIPFTAELIITTTSGRECRSPQIQIPVMQAKVKDRIVNKAADSTDEKYSLILFPFDSPNAGPINERIMNDYVYNRIFPTSNVQVIGHTDVVGLYEHNMKLSTRRSTTVFNGIQKQTKGKYSGLTTRGVGEDEPLYENLLPEGRFYNRTVQVLIKTPLSEFEK
jgi:outer membrane protein OmpA-like peptidoglycan-associated protein